MCCRGTGSDVVPAEGQYESQYVIVIEVVIKHAA